jgi:hypothetical protein
MDPEEYLYLSILLRWEREAPPDRHEGFLDGIPAKNTQTARMVKVLQMLTAGVCQDQAMRKLEEHTKRPSDGRSYVSRDSSWMQQPYEIGKGWYFEGNMSLLEKQKILDGLPGLGLSTREFANCAQDFVEARSVERYVPTTEEAGQIFERWKREGRVAAVEHRLEELGAKVDFITRTGK